jgi:hypothetical protein
MKSIRFENRSLSLYVGSTMAIASALAIFACNAQVYASPTNGGFVARSLADNNRPGDAPEENKYPQRWLVITGQKQQSLEIWFQIAYKTTNPNCSTQSIGGLIRGSPKVPQRIDEMVRVAASEEDFVLKLPLDRYVAGKCDWQATTVSLGPFLPELTSGPDSIGSFVFVTANGPRDIKLSEECQLHRNDYRQGTFPLCNVRPVRRIEIAANGSSIDATFTILPIAQSKK